MKKLADSLGAVFDVPEQHKEQFDLQASTQNNKGFTLQLASEVPPLLEEGYNNYTVTKSSNLVNDKGKWDAMKKKSELEVFIGGLPYDIEE